MRRRTKRGRPAVEWRNIRNFGGKYQASTEGKIAKIKPDGTRKILKKSMTNNGYETIGLSIYRRDENGERYTYKKPYTVNRIIAYTFLGAPPRRNMVAHHKDHVKYNNNIKNLEWLTCSENLQAASAAGKLGNNGHPMKIYDRRTRRILKISKSKRAAHKWLKESAFGFCVTEAMNKATKKRTNSEREADMREAESTYRSLKVAYLNKETLRLRGNQALADKAKINLLKKQQYEIRF